MGKIAVLIAVWMSVVSPSVFSQTERGVTADAGGDGAGQRFILHFVAGMATGFLASGLVDDSHQTGHPLLLPGVALSSATAAGIGKEVLDSTGFGTPRFADALFTTAGGLLAAAVVGGLQGARVESPVPLLSFGAILAIPVVIAFIEEIAWNIHKPRTASVRL